MAVRGSNGVMAVRGELWSYGSERGSYGVMAVRGGVMELWQ